MKPASSTIWQELKENERNRFLDLAEKYLRSGNVVKTAANEHSYAVASALILLRELRKISYDSLGKEVWTRGGVELLKSAFFPDMDLFGPVLDDFSKKCPDVAKISIMEVIRQEVESGSFNVINRWGKRLTTDQAEAIIHFAKKSSVSRRCCFLLHDQLFRNGLNKLVCNSLDEILDTDNWAIDKPEDYQLQGLALILNPKKHIDNVIAAIQSNKPSCGKEWLEAVMSVHEYPDLFVESLCECSPKPLASFYIWLNLHYPIINKPSLDSVREATPIDEIYDLKDRLIIHLTKCGKAGSTNALELVAREFPQEEWIKDSVLHASTVEQDNAAPILPEKSIRELYSQSSSGNTLITSVRDLHQYIHKLIENYNSRLQGDSQAVQDLWNIINDTIQPKSEDGLSDHLKRYLEDAIKKSVVINREVQIRRKQYPQGKSGSRTDIWVQCFDNQKNEITLCIEVKCNWNSSAKNAFEEQLVNKYLLGGSAKAGILLLGWFHCQDWNDKDSRKKKATQIWNSIDEAREELQKEARRLERKYNSQYVLSSYVLNCELA